MEIIIYTRLSTKQIIRPQWESRVPGVLSPSSLRQRTEIPRNCAQQPIPIQRRLNNRRIWPLYDIFNLLTHPKLPQIVYQPNPDLTAIGYLKIPRLSHIYYQNQRVVDDVMLDQEAEGFGQVLEEVLVGEDRLAVAVEQVVQVQGDCWGF